MHARWWAKRAKQARPGEFHPALVWLLRWCLCPLLRIFHRPTIDGLENLPEQGGYLIVANHSGGMAISEVLCFACLWLRLDGSPLAGMAHPFAFVTWPFVWIIRALGAIPATHGDALETLTRQVPLLVFPGGSQEATRPVWRANEVDLCGHKGFLRIAQQVRVPIVPMRITGSHFSAPILYQSRSWLAVLFLFPRLLGVKQYPLTALGLLGAGLLLWVLPPEIGWFWASVCAWAWVGGPLALTPWVPVGVRFRVGRPIAPEALFEEESSLDQALARVEQTLVQLGRERS